eukprot:g4941.t1
MTSPFGSSFSTGSQFGTSTGQTTPSFGITGGAFGSTGTSPSSLFNQPPPNQSRGAVFGGATSSNLFPSTFNQTPPSGFSPSPSPPAFGQTSTGFGQSSPGGFGQTPSSSLSGGFGSFGGGSSGPSPGTYGIAFEHVPESESSQPSRTENAKAYYMNMSAMTRYLNHPLEAIRATDYKNGHKRQSGNVQTNLRSPPTTGLFSSSTGFAQSTGMGRFGFGATTGGSMFGSAGGSGFGATPSTGGGMFRTSTSPGFGAVQSTSPSVFGRNQTGGTVFGQTGTGSAFGGGGGFGQSPATGGGLFGTGTTTSSVFGTQTGAGFSGLSSPQTSVFGSGTSPGGGAGGGGFSFGGNTGGGIFGSQSSGASLFGQTGGGSGGASPGSGMFGFQSSTPNFGAGQNLFQTGSSTPLFGQMNQTPNANTGGGGGMSLFQSHTSPLGQNPVPVSTPQSFFQSGGTPSAASSHPNWTPAYGIVAPNLIHYDEIIEGKIHGEKLSKFEYMQSGHSAKVVAIPYPVKYVLDEQRPMNNEALRPTGNADWAAGTASIAKPVEPTVQQKLEKWIQELKKQQESSAGSPPTTTVLRRTGQEVNRRDPVEELIHAEEARKHQRAADGLTDEEARALLPVISNEEYYVFPNTEGLLALIFARGKDGLKRVHGVEIGKRDIGSVTFSEPINLEKLNIAEAFQFKRGGIYVPPESPLKGIGGTVKLLKVFFKGANQSAEKDDIDLGNERNRAKRMCTNRGYTFCSFSKDGTWIFKIK